MGRYLILMALLLCLPVRGEAWQVLGGGVTTTTDAIEYESVAGDYVSSDEDTLLVVPKPSGTVSGDTLIAISTSYLGVITPPSGWTTEMSLTLGVTVFSKTASESEPSDYTFTPVGTYTYANMCIARISGSVSDITVSSALETSTYDTAVNFPSTNITSPGTLILWAGTRKTSGIDQPTMASTTRGSLIYNSGSLATATSLWISVEESPSYGSPITGAVGTLLTATNNKAAFAIVVE